MSTQAPQRYIDATYAAVFSTQFLFAALALALAFVHNTKLRHKRREGLAKGTDLEYFLTSRRELGVFRIGWSFYAGALGAWVISGPPSYATYAGLLGIIVYALASGIPILMIAYIGTKLQARFPHIMSAGDFALKRYGPLTQLMFVIVMLFNMSIALLAEYVTMGILFKDFLGSVSYGVIIWYGGLTLIYTAVGGLYISIITDTFQGIASVLLAAVALIYVASTFRYHLPSLTTDLVLGSKAEDQEQARFGLSSLASMPLSLFSATIFSEAMWQRCWASRSPRTLKTAAWLGCTGIVLIVFLSGFGGWLAAWAGRFSDNYNLQLFQVFPGQKGPYVNSWISVVTIVLAGIMSMGAVDSLQNGLTATVTAYLFRGRSVAWARGVVVVVNVALVVAAAMSSVSVLNLFLITNMLSTCCAMPMMAGVFDKHGRFISGDMVAFACAFAVFAVSVFGCALEGGSVGHGLNFTWYKNGYDWKYFIVASGSSLLGLLLAWLLAWPIRKLYRGPSLNEALAAFLAKRGILPDIKDRSETLTADATSESATPSDLSDKVVLSDKEAAAHGMAPAGMPLMPGVAGGAVGGAGGGPAAGGGVQLVRDVEATYVTGRG